MNSIIPDKLHIVKKNLSLIILNYLKFFAKLQLNKVRLLQKRRGKQLDIIGITGSAGKTCTLLACKAIFPKNIKVKTNDGYNSESGLPLSIIGLKITNYNFVSWLKIIFLTPIKYLINWQTYDILILEMGVDSPTWPKNMGYLLSIIKPNIGIFLNVSPVHLTNFSSLDQIAEQKAKLVNQAKVAIINSQDKLVVKHTINKNIINITPTDIKFKGFYLPPVYQIGFGAALALAKLFNISYSDAVKNIQTNFSLPPSRSSILKGIKNITIIDSSYNSSPIACQKLLEFLSTFKTKRIAILGDMRELGKSTPVEHRCIYQIATQSADIIISIGPQTKKYFGVKSKKFTYWWQASDYLKTIIKGNETILVKGSQNTIFLEELVKTILFDPNDSSKLCRQSKWWLKTKQNFKKENS
jgi:UDP-N-acetylmuramoyl-tripeptide--D-alanyl-D-alanine ligase